MKKQFIYTVGTLAFCSISLLVTGQAEAPAPESSSPIPWFEIIIGAGYVMGVFVLLPLVIYTNLKEGLFSPDDTAVSEVLDNLSETERNNKALEILESAEDKLTAYEDEEGGEMVTITSGSQAKFVKHSLDYINKYLAPTDAEILMRVGELTAVYEDRSQRAFTGSNWIIACSVGIAALFLYTSGFSSFIVIHLLGLVFYILSSRTTFYTIESRMDFLGGMGGVVGSIMTSLIVGNGTKYYLKHSDGSRTRDWETEGTNSIIRLVFMLFVALILGVLAPVLGVINFFMNYSTSFLLPFKTEKDWYASNFG